MRTSGFLWGIYLIGITTVALCSERPDVTRHDAQYLDHAVTIHVEWQSPNPVTKVTVSAGGQVKDLPVDEYDNRRNPYGYQGEVSVTLPVDTQGVSYVIQLEDDLRQKSAVVSGKASIQSTMSSENSPSQQQNENWGKKHLSGINSLHPSEDVGAAALIDRAVGLYDRIDSAPMIDSIQVNKLSPENVSFSAKAKDDKALQDVRIKVYNGVGTLVGFQSITGLGKIWQGTSQTFTLGGGSYRVVIQAIDNAGNTSTEQELTFQLTGRLMELQTVQEAPPVASTASANSKLSDQAPNQDVVTRPDSETLQPQTVPGL